MRCWECIVAASAEETIKNGEILNRIGRILSQRNLSLTKSWQVGYSYFLKSYHLHNHGLQDGNFPTLMCQGIILNTRKVFENISVFLNELNLLDVLEF